MCYSALERGVVGGATGGGGGGRINGCVLTSPLEYCFQYCCLMMARGLPGSLQCSSPHSLYSTDLAKSMLLNTQIHIITLSMFKSDIGEFVSFTSCF